MGKLRRGKFLHLAIFTSLFTTSGCNTLNNFFSKIGKNTKLSRGIAKNNLYDTNGDGLFDHYRSQSNINNPAPEHWQDGNAVGAPGNHYSIRHQNSSGKNYVRDLLKNLPDECGDFNKKVLETILKRPNGGGYGSQANNIPINAGQHRVYTPKNTSGPSYCSGETFGVLMDTMSSLKPDPFAKMTEDQLNHFRPSANLADSYGFWGLWNDNHNGARSSIVHFDLGQSVKTLAAACPGDFVKYGRKSGSGHSVVFLGYKNNGRDFCYWSSQSSTGGRGVNCESVNAIASWNIARITTPERISKIPGHVKNKNYLTEAQKTLRSESDFIVDPVIVDNTNYEHLKGAI